MSAYVDRYSRQELLPGWNQPSINAGRVVIAGIGALGSVVAMNLAMAGVGELVLVDLDTVEVSNLNRQILFRPSDIGRPKAKVAHEVLAGLNPDIKIESWPMRIQEVPQKTLRGPKARRSMLVDALDNFGTRRWLNSLSVSHNLTLVSGGMYGVFGNVQVIVPRKSACLECQPLIPERELQKACSLPGEVRRSLGKESKPKDSPDLTGRVPTSGQDYFPALGSVSSIVGGIMAHEVLKILQNSPESMPPMDQYLFVDAGHQSYVQVPLQRRDDCVVCSDKYHLQGVPFTVEVTDSLDVVKRKISLQFNLDPKRIIMSSKGVELSDSDQPLKLLLESKMLYIITPDLPTPLRLQLSWSE